MSLVTPDFGLIVWMTLIFGIVFLVLAKWGFPMITSSVRERAEKINASIKAAKEAEESLKKLEARQTEMIAEARKQQAQILKEASASAGAIIAKAQSDAREEAEKILAQARDRIAAEKESALADIRNEVAEKVLRKELSEQSSNSAFLASIVDEATGKASDPSKMN